MTSRSTHMRLLAVLSFAAAVSLHAGAPTIYSIDAHVIAAGSSVRAQNSCFRLISTIAEPVAGYSASANYSLDGGFLANLNITPGDDVFFDGFEGCTP